MEIITVIIDHLSFTNKTNIFFQCDIIIHSYSQPSPMSSVNENSVTESPVNEISVNENFLNENSVTENSVNENTTNDGEEDM